MLDCKTRPSRRIPTTLAVVGYSFATALVLNDWVKVGLAKAFGVRAAHGE